MVAEARQGENVRSPPDAQGPTRLLGARRRAQLLAQLLHVLGLQIHDAAGQRHPSHGLQPVLIAQGCEVLEALLVDASGVGSECVVLLSESGGSLEGLVRDLERLVRHLERLLHRLARGLPRAPRAAKLLRQVPRERLPRLRQLVLQGPQAHAVLLLPPRQLVDLWPQAAQLLPSPAAPFRELLLQRPVLLLPPRQLIQLRPQAAQLLLGPAVPLLGPLGAVRELVHERAVVLLPP
mmetsp:Transcript_95982/g.260575  ORF Transcript_95982/g.260575 Transcript_95982/m.260575 type:complete len:236 (-) Transcript_95982:3-710(-)